MDPGEAPAAGDASGLRPCVARAARFLPGEQRCNSSVRPSDSGSRRASRRPTQTTEGQNRAGRQRSRQKVKSPRAPHPAARKKVICSRARGRSRGCPARCSRAGPSRACGQTETRLQMGWQITAQRRKGCARGGAVAPERRHGSRWAGVMRPSSMRRFGDRACTCPGRCTIVPAWERRCPLRCAVDSVCEGCRLMGITTTFHSLRIA